MAEFLLELFSEEIPALMQQKAAETLKDQLLGALELHNITPKKVKHYSTPRRLCIIIEDLPKAQPSLTTEKRGPRVGAAEKAISGFLEATGLKNKAQLEKRSTPKGEFYFAVVKTDATPLQPLLTSIIEDLLQAFTWPKSMRWGDHDVRWVRPLHRILCLFEGGIIPLTFGHLKAGNITEGHRFLNPEPFEVSSVKQYIQTLHKHHVLLDQEARKASIRKQCKDLANLKNLHLVEDEALLNEVTGLVEWPTVICGQIDKPFMHLPTEVLHTTMRTHQRYFSLTQSNKLPAPYFLTTINVTASEDQATKLIQGNERVLRARFSDAMFFFEADKNESLDGMLARLDKITFHQQIGSMDEKKNRIIALAKFLSVWIPKANLLLVERAAQLSKADLASKMVQDFPELQGIMGSYYASYTQEANEVVHAIKHHYQPLGSQDTTPDQPVTVAVALADKIDTLVGLFIIGEKPTGSKDPFALRRAALGIIRIILDNTLRIPLKIVLDKALKLYPQKLVYPERVSLARVILRKLRPETPDSDEPLSMKEKTEFLMSELLSFFEDRIQALLKAQDIKHDLIKAVFDSGDEDDLLRLVSRVHILKAFLETSDGVDLLAAYRRAVNIVAKETKKESVDYTTPPSETLLDSEHERLLFSVLSESKVEMLAFLKEEKFTDAMRTLAKIRGPVDSFFTHVQVNCDDEKLRENRLRILAQTKQMLDRIANFSKIET